MAQDGLNGTYQLSADTPMGAQTITMELRTDGHVLTGSFSFMWSRHAISNGMVGDGKFACDVRMSVLMHTVEGHAWGTYDGNVIRGTIGSGLGALEFTGSRVG